jgi:hypothetical protein
MNAEQIIAEIEWLEQLFALPDPRPPLLSEWRTANRQNAATARLEKLFRLPDERPLQTCDWKTANQAHHETHTYHPRFQMWRRDGA